MATEPDLTTRQFVRILRKLPAHTPAADRFIKSALNGPGYAGVSKFGYADERAHMLSWFGCQNGSNGSGAYSRKVPNTSARVAYGRLQNAGSLLWIAEALGEDESAVELVAKEALQETDHRRRCKIVRGHFSWERVYALAMKTKGMSAGTGQRGFVL